MSNIIVTVGSVTTAMRLNKKLKSFGDIRTTVIHTPSVINQGGCSYSIRTSKDSLPLIKRLQAEGKIRYRKIYSESIINEERVYHDLS